MKKRFAADRRAAAVIPLNANRTTRRDYDEQVYTWRHLVENFFGKITEFRALATRCEKTASSYVANWHLAAATIA